MKKALVRTDYNFPGQKSVYHGKVRDVYNILPSFLPFSLEICQQLMEN